MISRLARPLVVAMLLMALSFAIARVVYAANYLGSGYFPTSNLYHCHIGSYYYSHAQYAFGTWSAATDLNMYERYYDPDIISSGDDYGDTGWTGYAYICSTSGDCDTQSAWNGTFRDSIARLNQYYLRNNDDDSIKWIALHEVGHCYSLAHRDSSSVMNSEGITVLRPNETDVDPVNTRY